MLPGETKSETKNCGFSQNDPESGMGVLGLYKFCGSITLIWLDSYHGQYD